MIGYTFDSSKMGEVMQFAAHETGSTTGLIERNYVVVVPAYGRDYTSAKACVADFMNGKDFQLQDYKLGEAYCSIHNFAPGVKVNLRYKRKTQVTVVVVPRQ